MSAIYTKILLPLDGSNFSATALPHAKELARRYDAELVLFQAIQGAPGYVAAGEPGMMTTVAIGPENEDIMRTVDLVRRSLEETADGLRKQQVKASIATQVGNPAECIVDYAANHKIDLIVMSTHGRTGLARWAFGSVAMKVIQAAACPVLTIRPAAK